MPNIDVDDYVRTQLPDEQQAIVARLRELLARHAPHAHETISRGSPAWKGERLLAIISRSATHITLAFARGAEFQDPGGLLQGSGKTTRHIKIRHADAIDATALRGYIRQAVALDLGDGAPDGGWGQT